MLKFFPLLGAILLSAAPANGHQSDDIYVLCRAVMDERPRDPSDNKEVNASGNSFYPPVRDQSDPNAFGREYVWTEARELLTSRRQVRKGGNTARMMSERNGTALEGKPTGH